MAARCWRRRGEQRRRRLHVAPPRGRDDRHQRRAPGPVGASAGRDHRAAVRVVALSARSPARRRGRRAQRRRERARVGAPHLRGARRRRGSRRTDGARLARADGAALPLGHEKPRLRP